MNTSATNTCPLAEETRAEIVSSPVGTKFNSISSLNVEEADASVVDASPKAKTMKGVLFLLSCGRGLAVSVVIVILALAGKGFIVHAHNDPPGTDVVDIADDMMMNVDNGINKQVSVVSGEGKNAVHYDFTKFGGGIPSDRTLQVEYTFTKFGNGGCKDVNNQSYDRILYRIEPKTSLADCQTKCAECPGQGQIGTELIAISYQELTDSGFCFCYIEDGGSYNANTMCAGIESYEFDDNADGTGAVCGSTGTTTVECWIVDDPNLQCATSTSNPSDLPSAQPSSSSDPSVEPSTEPSTEPSSEQSAQPSSSSDPSVEPSTEPSTEPSSEQSFTPSCTPSASPTEAPSKPLLGVNLFYPEWKFDDDGCRNDGDEPDYMAVNPTEWLSSSMKACCKKYFSGYLFDACMGRYPPDHDDCNTMLYYPDWNGSNEGCLDDGKEPYYMLSNHQYFLSNTREECCEKFYNWDFYTCSGTTPELTHGEWYPDWSGGGSTCLADGKIPVPDYMLSNQNWYLSTTQEKCCERHFYWDINECLGITVVGTDKWYVSYEDMKCVQDCSGGALPCGGVANPWEELFSSKEKCCKEKLPWVPKCRSN